MRSKLVAFFKDKKGHIVMWQFPNAFLTGWILCRVGGLFVRGDTKEIVDSLGTIFLAIWAILEIVDGASYFRRALGCLVLIVILASVIFS